MTEHEVVWGRNIKPSAPYRCIKCDKLADTELGVLCSDCRSHAERAVRVTITIPEAWERMKPDR
jgi:DNA-directed RNA polymerase subunit RPC12/RpoP